MNQETEGMVYNCPPVFLYHKYYVEDPPCFTISIQE